MRNLRHDGLQRKGVGWLGLGKQNRDRIYLLIFLIVKFKLTNESVLFSVPLITIMLANFQRINFGLIL